MLTGFCETGITKDDNKMSTPTKTSGMSEKNDMGNEKLSTSSTTISTPGKNVTSTPSTPTLAPQSDSTTPSNTNNSNSNIILSNNIIKNDKGLPKAMVKPQVLTHVIEGYVFQESEEAFTLNRPRYPERDMTDEPINKKRASINDIDQTLTTSPTLKCEHCGKAEQLSKMKKKKYCSTFCAKAAKNSPSPNSYSTPTSTTTITTTTTTTMATDQVTTTPNTASIEPRIAIDENNSNGQVSPSIIVGGEEAPQVAEWTVADVAEFIKNLPGCESYAEDFSNHEIDGQALLLLKDNHLLKTIKMPLGPAVKLLAAVDKMRGPKIEDGDVASPAPPPKID